MSVKLLGSLLVILACGAVGLSLAASYRMDIRAYREMIGIVDHMECELTYRLTPLPQLCRYAAEVHPKVYGQALEMFADELDGQVSPDPYSCMLITIAKSNALTQTAKCCIRELGQILGKFDLEGQLKGLRAIRASCNQRLSELEINKEVRLRSYHTLGLCAGAALAILLI